MPVTLSIEFPSGPATVLENVVGHVVVAVIKGSDGSLTLERSVGVNTGDEEDLPVVSGLVKEVEKKLNEVLPEPEPEPAPRLWLAD